MNKYEQICLQLKKNPKNWLVTGAAGFIGSHLAEKLLELGQNVVGFDNFSQGRRENIKELLTIAESSAGTFSMLEFDLRDIDSCKKACEGVDIILHQGAIGSVPRSISDPMTTYTNNVDGFVNILNSAKDTGIKRFVYASSSSVYGDAQDLPKVENITGKPLSPYALSKRINEEYGELYTRVFNMECIGLRYFNVFGPRQDPNGAYAAVVPRWFASLASGSSAKIYGDGETSRDFCYIENVVQANILAATASSIEAFGQAFNVAFEQRTTLNELFIIIRELACGDNSDIKPIYENFRDGDIRHSLADVSKAKKLLGYEPTIDVRSGLKKSADWYLKCI